MNFIVPNYEVFYSWSAEYLNKKCRWRLNFKFLVNFFIIEIGWIKLEILHRFTYCTLSLETTFDVAENH